MTIERCCTCKQPLGSRPTRVCYDCKKPMGNHDKWTYQERKGVMTMVHRHCDNPTSYRECSVEDSNH